jgi:hypothetical protein
MQRRRFTIEEIGRINNERRIHGRLYDLTSKPFQGVIGICPLVFPSKNFLNEWNFIHAEAV